MKRRAWRRSAALAMMTSWHGYAVCRRGLGKRALRSGARTLVRSPGRPRGMVSRPPTQVFVIPKPMSSRHCWRRSSECVRLATDPVALGCVSPMGGRRHWRPSVGCPTGQGQKRSRGHWQPDPASPAAQSAPGGQRTVCQEPGLFEIRALLCFLRIAPTNRGTSRSAWRQPCRRSEQGRGADAQRRLGLDAVLMPKRGVLCRRRSTR